MFLKVPPWTTMRSPRLVRLAMRTTLVKTLSMMERQRPAMMSCGVLPFFCSVMMQLFMKTVQREPSTDGSLAAKAVSEICFTGTFSDDAKFSRKEPQPAEQASLRVMPVTMLLVI